MDWMCVCVCVCVGIEFLFFCIYEIFIRAENKRGASNNVSTSPSVTICGRDFFFFSFLLFSSGGRGESILVIPVGGGTLFQMHMHMI